jgi:hypothetical protein
MIARMLTPKAEYRHTWGRRHAAEKNQGIREEWDGKKQAPGGYVGKSKACFCHQTTDISRRKLVERSNVREEKPR